MTAAAIAACVVFLGFSLRYAWWRSKVPESKPRVLMYHMIASPVPRARFNKLRVDPKMFERQIKWFRDDGWTFVFVSDILQNTQPKSVAITFDDGYLDNFTHADAILEKYDAKATLYLVVARHNRDVDGDRRHRAKRFVLAIGCYPRRRAARPHLVR